MPSIARLPLTAIALPLLLAAGGCSDYDSYGDRPGYAHHGHNGHDGAGYYRDGYYYPGDNDTVYRDDSGDYHCRKPDGSTGLLVGGVAGGVLGNVIAPGGSKTLGTILGAAGGAVAGRAIDRNNVRCR